MAASTRHGFGNIKMENTAIFQCDMQERFRPIIKYFADIIEVSQRLLEASKILEIPLIVTEQYPKALGSTVAELDISHAVGVYPKTKFGMLIPEVETKLKELGHVKHVILYGVETHVCVQQTAIDLLERGIEVYVVADATSSRSQMDRTFAFDRMRQAGVIVTTSESVLFQLIGDKDHPQFKAIQALIKVSGPESGLVSHKL